MPTFPAPANYRDPDKIADYISTKQASYLSQRAYQPYTGTVLAIEARLLGVLPPDANRGDFSSHFSVGADKPDPTAATKFANWLAHTLPAANERPPALFAFDARTFVKIAGIEAALLALESASEPAGACDYLPSALWFGSSRYRDIREALVPGDFELGVDGWRDASRALKVGLGVDWLNYRPCAKAKSDVEWVTSVLLRLGLVPRLSS